MNLKDVFDALTSSELLLHSAMTDGVIDRSFYNTLINNINSGLADIYRSVSLKIDYIDVPVIEGTKIYEIPHESNLEIIEIIDAAGITVPINGNPSFHSEYLTEWFSGYYAEMLSMFKFKLGNYNFKDKVVVKVKCLHPRIPLVSSADLDTFDPATISLELPYVALNALCLFVASKLGMAKDAQGILGKSPFHVGNNYRSKYDEEIVKLMVYGYDVGNITVDTKFIDNGFV